MATLADQIAGIRKRRQTAPPKGKTPLGTPTKATSSVKPPASKKPAAPLTPEQQADADAAAAVRTRFGGQEKEIQGQQRVSTQMQQNLGSWFDQYKADVEKARQNTAAFNTGVQAQQAAQAQQAQAVDTAQATTPEAQQAAAARRSTSDSFGSMLASQASTQNAYQADQGRIGSGEQQAQRVAEAGRAKSLADMLTDLQGQKGDYETQYRSDAKAAQHKADLEDAAFGLDQAKAEADVKLKTAAQDSLDADRTADNSRSTTKDKNDKMDSDRQYQLDKDKLGAAAAKDAYQKKHKLGPYAAPAGKKGPSAEDKRADAKRVDDNRKASGTALTRIDKAQAKWDSLAGSRVTTGTKDDTGHDKVDAKGQPETRAITDADRVAELVTEGYSKNEIHLMRMIAEGKKWGKQEIAMARQLGIKYIPRKYINAATTNKGSGGNAPSTTGAGDVKTDGK